MKNKKPLKIFECEGKLLIFGTIITIAYIVLRIMRLDIELQRESIKTVFPAMELILGFVIKDPGLGFFDNALWGGNIYCNSILISFLIMERYNSNRAYYIIRDGLRNYCIFNLISALLLSAIYFFGQELLLLIYLWLIKGMLIQLSELLRLILFSVLMLSCIILHILVIWFIGELIHGFMYYFIPLIVVTVEVLIVCLKTGAVWWCPLSIVVNNNMNKQNVFLFILIILFACMIVCTIISLIGKRKDLL